MLFSQYPYKLFRFFQNLFGRCIRHIIEHVSGCIHMGHHLCHFIVDESIATESQVDGFYV